MKKPYLKKYGVFSGFTVWLVDGEYIREYLDEEFTNFGQHYAYRFIPGREFWIDKDHGKENEEKYFIHHMFVENKLMRKGVKFDVALGYADRSERAERAKYEPIEQKKSLTRTKKEVIKKIHRRLLTNYSGDIKVWLVNGNIVRDLYFIDFTEGGHEYV